MSEAAALVETHSAVVVCVGDLAYKVKKPVDLGFLDFTSRTARQALCRQEVELNRRLAPDVYRGVYDLVDPSGEPVEHVVVMRRMPQQRSLRALVLADRVGPADLRPLVELLADFHGRAATSSAVESAGSLEAVRRNWHVGLDQLERLAKGAIDDDVVQRIRQLADRYLDGRGPLLEDRRRRGLLRDGHGDLLCADVYLLPDGPQVLDCLEFDETLRYGDVLLDMAFLAMDLEDLGRPDLAESLLAQYAEVTGRTDPVSLTRHYVAYRAQVRSKVALHRWQQGDAAARDDAARLAQLCLRKLESSTIRLVLVGGLPGTGKSTVAAAIAEEQGWLLLRTDVLREHSAGQAPAGGSYGTGAYAPERVGRTYDELLLRAVQALRMGQSVILDATWSSEHRRELARHVALDTSSDLVELVCRAPASVAADRIRCRAAAGTDASDADEDVAAEMAARFDPWPSAVAVETDQPLEHVLAHARRAVQGAPMELIGTRPGGRDERDKH